MKKYLIILAFLISGICSAQNLSYSDVFQAEGKSPKEIYNAIKAWSATAFRNAKYSTQVDNPESYFISFNSNIKYSYDALLMLAYDGWINFTLSIQCRDGRYKVEMSNIIHENKPTSTQTCCLGVIAVDENSYKRIDRKVVADIKQKTVALYDSLCKDLYEVVINSAQSTDDDW